MSHALIVEDEVDSAQMMAALVASENFTVATAHNLRDARRQIALQHPDLVLLDLQLPDGSGMSLFDDPELVANSEVVLITGHASLETSIQALRLGAADYLIKPVNIKQLQGILSRVMRPSALKAELETMTEEWKRSGHFGHLWGRSEAMQRIYEQISRVAGTAVSVFITGESGTGKELVASTVHELSRRRKQPFLAVNCGAISPNLIESEIFGHEKGSFTGADRQHQGFFERAHGGTLFLDEITEMPQELQVKLLRVLETGTFMRVGSTHSQESDVRVIAATNRAPDVAVAQGKLREDLMYRLNVFPIALPPLRDRADDITLLAEHFMAGVSEREGRTKRFSAAALLKLQRYRWPGNVRELRNVVQRAYVMATGDTITDEWLPSDAPHAVSPAVVTTLTPSTTAPQAAGSAAVSAADASITIKLGTSMAEAERQLILATLAHFNNHKERTAASLGVSLKTLYNRLKEYQRDRVGPEAGESQAESRTSSGWRSPARARHRLVAAAPAQRFADVVMRFGEALLVERRLPARDPVAPAVLGRVQRDVGAAQQIGGRAVRQVGHADRYRHARQRDVVMPQRQRADALAQQVEANACLLDRGARQQQRQLLAADAAGQVVRAHEAAQLARHGLQHFVAGLVPEGVVERLEVIDVEQRQGQVVAGALGARDLAAQRVVEVAAVVQAGQPVAHRLLAQRHPQVQVGQRQAQRIGDGFGAPAGRAHLFVAERLVRDHVQRAGPATRRDQRHADGMRGAVGQRATEVRADRIAVTRRAGGAGTVQPAAPQRPAVGLAARERLGKFAPARGHRHRALCIRKAQRAGPAAEQLGAGARNDRAGLAIAVAQLQLLTDLLQRLQKTLAGAHLLHQLLEVAPPSGGLRLGLLQRVDADQVAAQHRLRVGRIGAVCGKLQQVPARAATGMPQPQFALHRLLGLAQRLLDGCSQRRRIVGMEQLGQRLPDRRRLVRTAARALQVRRGRAQPMRRLPFEREHDDRPRFEQPLSLVLRVFGAAFEPVVAPLQLGDADTALSHQAAGEDAGRGQHGQDQQRQCQHHDEPWIQRVPALFCCPLRSNHCTRPLALPWLRDEPPKGTSWPLILPPRASNATAWASWPCRPARCGARKRSAR